MTDKQDGVFAVMGGVSVAEPRPHVHCTRCDERLVTETPIRVDTYVAITRAFANVHQKCKPRTKVGA